MRSAHNDDAWTIERSNLQRKQNEGGLFRDQDSDDRKALPLLDRKKPVNEEIIVELYNRYRMLLDELSSYKSKLIYFLQVEDEKDPEYLLETKNINFHERINKLEDFLKAHMEDYNELLSQH